VSGEDLGRLARRMPKAELHLHFEGSVPPALLLELARKNRVALPADDVAGLRRWFRFEDFEHFVQVYVALSRCLRDPEDFQRAAEAILESQAGQNVLYSEVHLTISTHHAHGVNVDEVGHALGETLAAAGERFGVEMALIPDIVRNVPIERADLTLEWALAHRRHGVVALGLSGLESWPTEPFAEHFAAARAEGLHRVAHAGEHAGPESIRLALDLCDPERIGHGIRAVDDPALVAELRERDIPLEVCPTSNVRLGAAADLSSHPVRELLELGAPVTLHSDDPALFDTSLSEEYRLVAESCGLTAKRLAELSLAALAHAFLPAERRRDLEAAFERELAELGLR